MHMDNRTAPPLLTHDRSGTRVKRIAYAVLGFAIAAVFVTVAFFFLAVAAVAGALLALVIGVRLWWVMRRMRAARKAAGPLEGEYTVVKNDGAGERTH